MTNNITKLCSFALTLLTLLIGMPTLAGSATELKTVEVDFFNDKVNRPTKVKFWYKSGVEPCSAKICLTNTQNPQRIAIISHGAFGSPRSMNWLGYALASQDWIVAGVAHYGESWIYGTETIDPNSVRKFWNRPQDVSFVIDSLSDTALFNTTVIADKVIMLGHSSGGFTSLAMVGAKLELGKSEIYCKSDKAKLDKGCLYGKQSELQPTNPEQLVNIGPLQEEMYDERIVAAIALDPALGHATSEQSLKNINVPTLVFGSVENDFLPFSVHAKYYASHIEGANLVGIEQGAGHFVYIDQCNFEIEANGVHLCKDRKGVDRKLIQQQMLQHLFNFLNQNGLNNDNLPSST